MNPGQFSGGGQSSDASTSEPTDHAARIPEFQDLVSDDLPIAGYADVETSSGYSRDGSDYLKEHFGRVLPVALREIAMKRPLDPVRYLGRWLLHYRECEERERRRQEFEEELLEQRLRYLRLDAVSEPSESYRETKEEEEEEEEGNEEGNECVEEYQ